MIRRACALANLLTGPAVALPTTSAALRMGAAARGLMVESDVMDGMVVGLPLE